MRFCRAFIFSLILLLLLYTMKISNTLPHHPPFKTDKPNKMTTKKNSKKIYTFSERLWTSAARLLLGPFRAGAGFAACFSSAGSAPSYTITDTGNTKSQSKPHNNLNNKNKSMAAYRPRSPIHNRPPPHSPPRHVRRRRREGGPRGKGSGSAPCLGRRREDAPAGRRRRRRGGGGGRGTCRRRRQDLHRRRWWRSGHRRGACRTWAPARFRGGSISMHLFRKQKPASISSLTTLSLFLSLSYYFWVEDSYYGFKLKSQGLSVFIFR